MKALRVLAPLVSVLALFATASPVAADGNAPHVNPLAIEALVPLCLAGQPGLTIPIGDGASVTACRVNALQVPAGGWQASSSEWILFRIGDAENTLAACLVAADTTTVLWTLDGAPVAGFQIPCNPGPTSPGTYRTDWVLISRPLTSGVHTFTVTWISNGIPAFTLNRSITVV